MHSVQYNTVDDGISWISRHIKGLCWLPARFPVGTFVPPETSLIGSGSGRKPQSPGALIMKKQAVNLEYRLRWLIMETGFKNIFASPPFCFASVLFQHRVLFFYSVNYFESIKILALLKARCFIFFITSFTARQSAECGCVHNVYNNYSN